MEFGTKILSPSYLRQPEYNSVRPEKQSFEFRCVSCSANIEIRFKTFIGREFGWAGQFEENEQVQIGRHFDMNTVGKAPDGGWPAIETRQCEKCSTKYLIYAGVNEYANSAYKITLQGITQLIDESTGSNI